MVRKDKKVYDWLTLTAGVMTKDAMRFTPPTLGKGKTSTWAAQKEAGQRAVARDIRKIFFSHTEFVATMSKHPLCQQHPKLLALLSSYFAAGDYQKLNTVLKKMGSRLTVIQSASRDLHFSQRNYQGRVNKPSRRYFVLSLGSIKSYVSLIQKDVGKLKAGFMAAVNALGVKDIPKWVSVHSTPGTCDDQRRAKGTPYVAVQNLSPNTGGVYIEEIVQRAAAINEPKMRNYLQFQLSRIPHPH